MRLKFEIDLPNSLDLVLSEDDYKQEAAKIAMQIKAALKPQMSPNPDAKLNRQFLGDTMLLGMGFEATGKILKKLSADFAERGRWEP